MKTIIALLLAVCSGSAMDGNVDRFCFKLGDIKEQVCAVSISTLIANGQDFDGRLVSVNGYFAYADIPMLFATKDSFMSSNVADGVAVSMPKNPRLASKLYGLDHGFIQIMGRYSAKPVDTTRYQAYRTGGRIAEIESVGAATTPWGYTGTAPYQPGKSTERGAE
ncbi:hypothetical protein [Dyella sp. 2RAB6]|uniref:hypothetical protein n=1 Tax=Dyella sp. 2RAB6 TaxID=3232992 RepID=UPI003F903EAD